MTIFPRAVSDPNGLALDDLRIRRSWAELEDRTRRTVGALRDLGVRPDDHVAVLMHNRAEALELVAACIVGGVWVTPINWHLAPNEVEFVVQNSGARVVFCDDAHQGIARDAGAPQTVTVGDELESLLAAASDAPIDLAGPPGGTMIYTSGTTGRPKGVKRRRAPNVEAALEAQRAYADMIGFDGSGTHLVTGPLYHASPLHFAVYEQQKGAPVVIMPRWDAEQCLELIDEREVHHAHFVPTMFVRLLRLEESVRARSRRPALHVALHGAAPISPGVKRAMIDWWGPILLEYWGGSEGGIHTMIDSATWLEHPGSVGQALPGYEVFAVGEEGQRLPAGEIGVLYSRDIERNRIFEYHGEPEQTAAAFLAPDTFTLNDMGWLDDAGFVHLADRKSHMIISGGVNIYPAEIEAVLIEHPAVRDVGVFGVPDDEWGESVKAAVELADGNDPSQDLAQELLTWARQRLAGYKVPRSIDFEAELPRHPSGKLYIRRLRDRYWEGRERKI
jgi:long-chain acyl-CoA synthetase